MIESNLKKIERERAIFSFLLIGGVSALSWLQRPWHEIVFFGVVAIIVAILLGIRDCLESIRFMQAHDFHAKHIGDD